MTIALQSSVVYGPISSRRLGTSLGINILPTEVKFCLSNCIYCQYGWTDLRQMRSLKLQAAGPLLKEIEKSFSFHSGEGLKPDSITFSGNGEPTLHPEFGKLVRGVKKLRDRFFPGVPVAALSDSSRVHLQEVRQALCELDRQYMKLDAGDRETYLAINNPAINYVNFDFNQILEGLHELPRLTLQSLFLSAPVDNSNGPALRNWLNAVQKLSPQEVHLYTVDRPSADHRVRPAPWPRLLEIEKLVRDSTAANTFVFSCQAHSSRDPGE